VPASSHPHAGLSQADASSRAVVLAPVPGRWLFRVPTRASLPHLGHDMRIDAVPDRLAIMGVYIAAEFAHIFAALGSQVTVSCATRTLRSRTPRSRALHRSGAPTVGCQAKTEAAGWHLARSTIAASGWS